MIKNYKHYRLLPIGILEKKLKDYSIVKEIDLHSHNHEFALANVTIDLTDEDVRLSNNGSTDTTELEAILESLTKHLRAYNWIVKRISDTLTNPIITRITDVLVMGKFAENVFINLTHLPHNQIYQLVSVFGEDVPQEININLLENDLKRIESEINDNLHL